ncbi:hypothetical protein FO519_007246 [Halicephalobus sp. NKZ332]|nr:hypothetical protein FO519_007246 [Halicephalobus sp. NKZ332]
MSVLFTNYSALTVDDLYHPTLVYIYSIYWDVSLCVSTIFFFFMLYTILKKSPKEMKEYGGWKPVPLWPFYLGYSVGWYSNIPRELVMLPLVGVTFFSVGMGFSIYISVLHRYVQASPFSLWYKKYSYLPIRFCHYVVIFVILECGLCIPLWIFKPDPDQLKNTIISQAKYMNFLYDKYPNIFGFSPEMNGGDSITFMGVLIGVFLSLIISIIFLYLNFLRILKKNKNLLSVNTYRMQITLFRTLCVQIALAVFLLIVPITSCLTLAIFNVKWVSKFSLFMFMVTSTHAFADFAILVYFIKPYRIFLLQCIDRLIKPLGCSVFTSSPISIIQATSTVPIS